MPRLLIQCQGNSGPLSFTVGPERAAAILRHYHQAPEHAVVIPIVIDDEEVYYINLALVSWIQSWTPTKESEPKPTGDS